MPKTAYDIFSLYYDFVMLDYAWCEALLKRCIEMYASDPKSLVEFACGTGNVLKWFAPAMQTTGVDLSEGMIQKAQSKIPSCEFTVGDMRTVRLKRRFDIALCVYDSINHLLEFSHWKQFFQNVREHLNPNGVFIFDMNTAMRLQHITTFPVMVQEFGKNAMLMKVRSDGAQQWNFNVRIFEHEAGNRYKLSEFDVPETAYDLPEVTEELRRYFGRIELYDSELNRITDEAIGEGTQQRVFFVCSNPKSE